MVEVLALPALEVALEFVFRASRRVLRLLQLSLRLPWRLKLSRAPKCSPLFGVACLRTLGTGTLLLSVRWLALEQLERNSVGENSIE